VRFEVLTAIYSFLWDMWLCSW